MNERNRREKKLNEETKTNTEPIKWLLVIKHTKWLFMLRMKLSLKILSYFLREREREKERARVANSKSPLPWQHQHTIPKNFRFCRMFPEFSGESFLSFCFFSLIFSFPFFAYSILERTSAARHTIHDTQTKNDKALFRRKLISSLVNYQHILFLVAFGILTLS